MKELFKEYGLLCLIVVVSFVAISIFFSMFWSDESALASFVNVLLDGLL